MSIRFNQTCSVIAHLFSRNAFCRIGNKYRDFFCTYISAQNALMRLYHQSNEIFENNCVLQEIQFQDNHAHVDSPSLTEIRSKTRRF
jgi:hypothetical protein